MIFEKIILNRIKLYLDDTIPSHEFGFQENHGTIISTIHRNIDVLSRVLEKKSIAL